MNKGEKTEIREPQEQSRPGIESKMTPEPIYDNPDQKGSGKLQGKTALITGGDSGIGRAVAILFAKEGADIAFGYLNEHSDAEKTKNEVENYGRRCISIPEDISKEEGCLTLVSKTLDEFGKIDILVNNAAVHFPAKTITDISTDQLYRTFETNFFSYFWVTKAVLPHLKEGSTIINSTSVTAYRGSGDLMDYAATKGAITAFTRSLALNLMNKNIRVNAVAPGPIWTPLIPSSFDESKVAKHGSDAPMKRAGEPVEVAPSYLFLAGNDSTYFNGQVLHPNGGEILNT
ncbi:MAG TPA: SDR family oxidoreductase [Lentimicrobium sp.]|nr:SDR family oxidoreductase [Lentimicrobium sp.]